MGEAEQAVSDEPIDVILLKVILIVNRYTALSLLANATRKDFHENWSEITFVFPEFKKELTVTVNDEFLRSKFCSENLAKLLINRMVSVGILSTGI